MLILLHIFCIAHLAHTVLHQSNMCIFLNGNVRISIDISLKCVPKGPMDHIPALVQIMAWRRPGDKPLSEPIMISLLTHICITRINELTQHRKAECV